MLDDNEKERLIRLVAEDLGITYEEALYRMKYAEAKRLVLMDMELVKKEEQQAKIQKVLERFYAEIELARFAEEMSDESNR